MHSLRRARFSMPRLSALTLAGSPAASIAAFILSFGMPSPALSEFDAVFLRWPNAAVTTRKKNFSSDISTDGSGLISSLIPLP